MYYYHDGENEVGPYSEEKLKKLADAGLVGAGTLVRAVNSESWVPFAQVAQMDATNSTSAYAAKATELIKPTSHASYGSEASVVDGTSVPSSVVGAATRETVPSNDAIVSSTGWLAHPPTPWRRYAARMLDTTLNGTIVFTLLAIAFYSVAPASADRFFSVFETEGGRFLDILLTAVAASFLNGLLIGVSGFTLGKWIFGIKVTELDERKIGLSAGLARDFAVLVKGLGLAIPIVSLFTMWFSFKKLNKDNHTSWDEGKYVVWHRPAGAAQYLLNVIGILLIFLVFSAVGAMSEV